MAQLIQKKYAAALFELSIEKNSLDDVNDQIKLIYDAVKNDSEIIKVMQSPRLESEAKFNIIKNAFGEYVCDDVLGFIALIFRKNRENLITEILEEFIAEAKRYKGIAEAQIVSAKPIKPEKLDEITKALSKKFNKQIEVKTTVDPSLIGGLKINVCGHLIDSTIKKQVDDIRKNLLDIRLA